MMTFSRRKLLGSGIALSATAMISTPALMRRAYAAENETLVLYNGQHEETTAAIVDAFTKASGINVDIRKGSSIQLANQIIEEGDHSPADMFYSEESPPLAALAERGLLAPLPKETIDLVRPGYAAGDGSWVGITARCRVAVYNKDMIDESELPDSVLDMATEKWKGRVAFVPTSGAFQQQIVAISVLKGRDVALEWLKGLKQYGQIYNKNSAAMAAVERGEIATGLINNYYCYNAAKEKGAENMKSALHFFKGGDPGALVTVSAAGVLKTAKNAEAAQKLVAFMVGEDGQKVLADIVAEWPMNPNVQSSFNLVPFEDLQPPDINPAKLGDADEALELRREAGLA